MLSDDRYFDPDLSIKAKAIWLYNIVKNAPIIAPHGHVDPAIFSQPDYHFPNPAALLIQTDHYILRMLISQGVSYDTLLSEENPRKIWDNFAEKFHLFRGTPSGLWITHELEMVFGITEILNAENATSIYDQIEKCLLSEYFTSRNLFKKFEIELLATTDLATDTLFHHQAIRKSGWDRQVIPTLRIDDLLHLDTEDWVDKINKLSEITKLTINSYSEFVRALEHRREAFKAMGAKATDVGVISPRAIRLSALEINRIFESALKGEVTSQDTLQFSAHMVYEMARMSCEDGLVMQIHPGVFRNYNPQMYNQYGADIGFDIPVKTEFTNNLHPLLSDFGNHPNFHLILFTLDESTYSRELAPLAGVYPSIKFGPPWWFLDSWNGIKRYFDTAIEIAGIYNTVGFNDDTRAFLSIPARHDVWRRASANWLAGLLMRGLIDENDAEAMIYDLAVGLAKSAYQFE